MKIVLIACSKIKITTYKYKRIVAEEMYCSALFRKSLNYARIKHDGYRIFVLSAKYGLVPIEKKISLYDLSLNYFSVEELKKWSSKVNSQLEAVCTPSKTDFVILAGKRYRCYLTKDMKSSYVPLEGLKIGEQLGKLTQLSK